jgi:uncharacterized lipoprotein YddW (UPF0748 family)
MPGTQATGANMQKMNMNTVTPVTAPANAASYTCPMHPSVVTNAPGACPYCGMALTRKR